MPISIKDPEADQLVRELARRTGESLTQAVIVALRERLRREQGRARGRDLVLEMRAIAERLSTLPVLDRRSANDIIGYDENGLPR